MIKQALNESLIISNDKGLRIGAPNTIDIAVVTAQGKWSTTCKVPLDFKIKNDDGVQKNVVRVDSYRKILHRNTITPEALDVSGSHTSK